ncbi:SIS domain-containing protein (plasmid) [Rhizobium sp. NIBRBAC000502774]|nr:SIS domain-containing protein [Rhizobium sp. NIBRBAC000502774]
MLREIREIPTVVARQLVDALPAYWEEGLRLRREKPRFIITCARGSSDQAALFFKYLVETRIGIPVASVGPSVASVYASSLDYRDGVCLTVSQSGGSPDLASLQAAARAGGARTVALLNTPQSLVGDTADTVLPMFAGPELAVAATKSYVASLVALLAVIAAWSDDRTLMEALKNLPVVLDQAVEQDWSAALIPVAASRSLFTIARGPTAAVAGEAALKLKETCRLHAEAYSAAEVRHGPIALARDRFAAILFATEDQGGTSLREAGHALADAGASVFAVGSSVPGLTALPFASAGHPLVDPVSQVSSFYRFVEALSVALGENPDKPDLLKKVTETV